MEFVKEVLTLVIEVSSISTFDESSPPQAKRGVSPFFYGACNILFKEGLKDEVYLSEADPEVFDAFMEWVYTSEVKFSAWPINKTSKLECKAWWSFGTKLSTGPNLIDLLYKSTAGDRGLRGVFVALNVWRSGAGHWRGDDEQRTRLSGLPAEYSNDLVVQLSAFHHLSSPNAYVTTMAAPGNPNGFESEDGTTAEDN
ncbi:hypothetical protein GJ744_002534 [Endocarpon pusillum]|uniref:BTB domain-containing protein n=1 Tax=Endocarpon pusillum TaxID=364733 RepID=A0A8H7ABV2_9EURO|nr:hypothetical protein GJ744_002534 [Endocarpon pusillum]